MPWIHKNHPVVCMKGMASSQFDSVFIFNTYVVDWTNDIFNSLNTKEEFSELLTATFKDNLISNNVNSSKFDANVDGDGIYISYGSSRSGSSLGTWSSAWTMSNNGPSIFSVKNIKKPKKIYIKFSYEDNASCFSHLCLRFTGNVSNAKYIPVIFNDGYRSAGGSLGVDGNGLMINHNKTPIQAINAGYNHYELELDTETQLSNCFTDPSDSWYTFEFVSLSTVRGGSTQTTTPLYLEQLSIEV